MTGLTRRRGEQASHLDDWLITYADMITLLLCLFVTFVIVQGARKVPALPAVAAAVHMPLPAPAPQTRPVARQTSDQPPARTPTSGGDRRSEVAGEASIAAPAADHAGMVPVKIDHATSLSLAVIPPPELAGAPTSPDAVAAAPKQNVAELPKGDRITTLDMGSAAFFDSGSAALSESGKAILHGVLTRLTAALAAGYRIEVEGHTDDTPIHTAQFPSNWELSAARASAVVQFFVAEGLPAQRLRAVGYADTEPKAPNRDAAGTAIPQNQAENRRVVIVLEKIERLAQ